MIRNGLMESSAGDVVQFDDGVTGVKYSVPSIKIPMDDCDPHRIHVVSGFFGCVDALRAP